MGYPKPLVLECLFLTPHTPLIKGPVSNLGGAAGSASSTKKRKKKKKSSSGVPERGLLG